MPIPTAITDLSTTAASNSPTGSDSPTDGDNYLRAHAAFIAELNQRLDIYEEIFTTPAGTSLADLQAAIDSFGSEGGTVQLRQGVNYTVTGDLTVKPNVTIRGPYSFVGSPADNASAPYDLLRGALILSSSATIKLKGGAGLYGVLVYRSGMTFPAANTSAYAGTAITGEDDDCFVTESMILGFNKAYYSTGQQRPRIESTYIDCLSGIHIVNCADISRIRDVHCWPFATIAAGGASTTLERSGTAFLFETLGDWNSLQGCFAYGYEYGFRNTNCNSMTYLNCGADNTATNSGSIGFAADGTSTDTSFDTCLAAAQETGYYVNCTTGVHTQMDSCRAWGNTTHGVLIQNGDVSITGGVIRDVPNAITCDDATSNVYVDNVRFSGVTVPFNWTVSTSKLRLGDNDFGDFVGNPVGTNVTVPNVATASSILLPNTGSVFNLTGTTGFGTLNYGWAGREVTLIFGASATAFHSTGAFGAMRLSGETDFAGTAGDTLTLMHNGVQWYETGRSA